MYPRMYRIITFLTSIQLVNEQQVSFYDLVAFRSCWR